MAHWQKLDEDRLSDGSRLELYEKAGQFQVRAGGLELMSSASPQSEQLFVREIWKQLEQAPPDVILIGGLGLGFSLQEVCKMAAATSEIVVCEISPRVVEWNYNHLHALNGDCLLDDRVSVIQSDIFDLLEAGSLTFDLVLMDVDNGPKALVHKDNDRLYDTHGLALLKGRMNKNGRAGFWSSEPSPTFEGALTEVFGSYERSDIPLPQAPNIQHTFYSVKQSM